MLMRAASHHSGSSGVTAGGRCTHWLLSQKPVAGVKSGLLLAIQGYATRSSTRLSSGSARWMKVVQADEYTYYFGGARGSSSSSSSSDASVAETQQHQQVQQQLLNQINCAASPWELLSLASEHQGGLQLQAWLRLSFKVLVALHEEYEQCHACSDALAQLHEALPRLLAATAAALRRHVDAACGGSSSSSSSSGGGSSSTGQVELVRKVQGQVADLLFAAAVHAVECSQQAAAAQAVDDAAASSTDGGSRSRRGSWWLERSCVELVDAAAAMATRADSLVRGDAVSVLWAGGELTRLQRTQQQAAAAAAAVLPHEEQRQAMVAHLASHIAQLIQESNNTAAGPGGTGTASQQQAQEPWHAEDLADAVAGLAAAGYASPAAARLLDAAAHEVYRQLSNRHSSAGGFSVEAVVQLLGSYATLNYSDGPSGRMFDAVAGWLVKRVRARHMQAPSNPQQLAAVADVYARLAHNSVVVPELLNALGLQACRAGAAAVELHAAAPEVYHEDPASSYCHWRLAHAATFLRAHMQLGYSPTHTTLTALAAALLLHLPHGSELQGIGSSSSSSSSQHQQAQDALAVLEVLATLQHHPGQQVLGALLSAAWPHAHTLSTQQQAALLFASAQLAAPLPHYLVAAALEDVVLAAEGSGSGRSRQRGLTAAEIVRVLWSGAVFGVLDVARLGWLLVALAGAAWQQLSEQQLLVVVQAQLVVGGEGQEMAGEVLPPQLLSRAHAAWQRWCGSSSVPVHGGSAARGGVQPPGCDADSWRAHALVAGWLAGGEGAAALAACGLAWRPVLLPAGSGSEEVEAGQQRALLGAWLLEKQGGEQQHQQQLWPDGWPKLLQAPLGQQQPGVAQQQLLLLCQQCWLSSNEPQRPLGPALLQLQLVSALVRQQQGEQLQLQPLAALHLSVSSAARLLCKEG